MCEAEDGRSCEGATEVEGGSEGGSYGHGVSNKSRVRRSELWGVPQPLANIRVGEGVDYALESLHDVSEWSSYVILIRWPL